jgi:DNA mismatch repair protein MSH6
LAFTEKNLEDETKEFSEKIPFWALPENVKDIYGKRPSEENYDPTTLYVPKKELEKLTATMKQYWEIKVK